jgi:hypothetical protein
MRGDRGNSQILPVAKSGDSKAVDAASGVPEELMIAQEPLRVAKQLLSQPELQERYGEVLQDGVITRKTNFYSLALINCQVAGLISEVWKLLSNDIKAKIEQSLQIQDKFKASTSLKSLLADIRQETRNEILDYFASIECLRFSLNSAKVARMRVEIENLLLTDQN